MTDKAEALGAAIATLADCCAATSGNVHTIHLNIMGEEFDTYHKKITQAYYEALDDDYDELAEWARCYDYVVENKNESAARVEFQSLNGVFTRDEAVGLLATNLEQVLGQFKLLFNAVNELTDCPIAIGVANWLQDRIQYWAKEVYFFNAKRKGKET
jgi:DNA-binding ferritin-like protein